MFSQTAKAQFETSRDSVVQLFGVIMTADSLVGIPAVSVMVKGQNRGTISNAQGVFSIVVLNGAIHIGNFIFKQCSGIKRIWRNKVELRHQQMTLSNNVAK